MRCQWKFEYTLQWELAQKPQRVLTLFPRLPNNWEMGGTCVVYWKGDTQSSSSCLPKFNTDNGKLELAV